MKKHFLVTGGAGFIGSHLVERLLGEGNRVTVIDDLSTGRIENLDSVKSHPSLRVVIGKVSSCPDLNEIAASADFVFHLAAAVGVELVVKSPIQTIRTNLVETEAILEAVSGPSVPILAASTSEVYGKSQKDGFEESDDLLIGPPHLGRWSYACSKLMDEFLALAYAKEKQLPAIIVRLFNTVGPRQTGRFGMVLPRFIEAAQRNQPLRVYGDGRQSRCFCFVSDTVEAMVRLAASEAARGQVFNIGSSEEISINDLALLVIQTLKSSSTLERIPYSQAYAPGFEDMQRRKPVVDKLHRVTGFKPATSIRDIILKTAEPPAGL